jgi:hypothetical protein
MDFGKPTVRAAIGGAVWIAFVVLRVPDARHEHWALALVLLAAAVLLPLAFALWRERDEERVEGPERLLGRAERAQLPAAVALAVALGLEPGVLAAGLALPWATVLGLMAAAGVGRIRRDKLRRPLEGLAADAGLIFGGVGAAWLLADRAGWQPLGFPAPIVALTAVHFHYAGLLLPLFAGLVQRELLMERFASRALVGVVLGVPATALGITATQLGWGTSLETGAGCGLALAGMAVGVLKVRLALDAKRQELRVRVLMAVAGTTLFLAMVLAGAYALRGAWAVAPWLGLPQMRLLHGSLNALGCGLAGVLAWRAWK